MRSILLSYRSNVEWMHMLDLVVLMGLEEDIIQDVDDMLQVVKKDITVPIASTIDAVRGVEAVMFAKGREKEGVACRELRRGFTQQAVPRPSVDSSAVPWSTATVTETITSAWPTPDADVALMVAGRPYNIAALEWMLNGWVLKGSLDEALVAAYDAAVEQLIVDLMRTVPSSNYTIIGRGTRDSFEAVFDPEMCGLPAILARGARLGAHTYTSRDAARRRFSELHVLEAAEALAATCFRLYGDPAVGHLQHPLRFDASGTVSILTDSKSSNVQAQAKPCIITELLLRSFYDLYEYTSDPIYGAWSTHLMQEDSFHCPRGQGGGSSNVQYMTTLRYYALILIREECNHLRPSSGLCELGQGSLMSPNHHLVTFLNASKKSLKE